MFCGRKINRCCHIHWNFSFQFLLEYIYSNKVYGNVDVYLNANMLSYYNGYGQYIIHAYCSI